MKYTLSDEFIAISETAGIIQNLSTHDSVEITDSASAANDTGLIVYPQNSISYDGQIYARSISGANVEVRVEPLVGEIINV